MNWQEFCDGVTKIFNTPTMISGVTIGSLLIFVLMVLTKTSIGKKALNKLKDLLTHANKELESAKNQLLDVKDEFEKFKENKEKEFEEMVETYEVLLVGVRQEAKNVEQLLLTISENIHNGKVQEAVKEYIDNKEDEVTQEISSIIETEKESARSEYEKELEELKSQLDEVKAIINDGAEVVKEIEEDGKEIKDNLTNLQD